MYHLNWRPVFQSFDLLWQGILLGLGLALLSLTIGCVIGLLAAFARVYGGRKLRALVTAYTEFIRNIPLLLIIYFVFYGLGIMGFHLLNNVWSFVLALSIYSGAYLAEVFRAGIIICHPPAHLPHCTAVFKQHLYLAVQGHIPGGGDFGARTDLRRHGDQYEYLAHTGGLHDRGGHVPHYVLPAGGFITPSGKKICHGAIIGKTSNV